MAPSDGIPGRFRVRGAGRGLLRALRGGAGIRLPRSGHQREGTPRGGLPGEELPCVMARQGTAQWYREAGYLQSLISECVVCSLQSAVCSLCACVCVCVTVRAPTKRAVLECSFVTLRITSLMA